MITVLHEGGGGSLGTPKIYYVICARPLKVKWWKQKRGGGRCHKSVVKSAEVRTKSSKNSGFVGIVPDLKRQKSVLFYPFAVLIICLLLFC